MTKNIKQILKNQKNTTSIFLILILVITSTFSLSVYIYMKDKLNTEINISRAQYLEQYFETKELETELKKRKRKTRRIFELTPC